MNIHVDSFLEGLVFADECGKPTAALRESANSVIGWFLMFHAHQVAHYDENSDAGEGAAAFDLALYCTGMETDVLSHGMRKFADTHVKVKYPR